MREKVENFLANPYNLELIQNNEWDKIYDKELNNYGFWSIDKGDLTITLLSCEINPLEQGLNYIPENFLYNSEIEEFIIPNNVVSIGYKAFYYCTSLVSVMILDGVKSIDGKAFYNCTSLTEIIIPNSVISIDQCAFYHCKSLKSITIGNGVTNIGTMAFCGCDNLTSIKFNGTTAEWNNIEKGEIWNHQVPATKVICNNGEIIL